MSPCPTEAIEEPVAQFLKELSVAARDRESLLAPELIAQFERVARRHCREPLTMADVAMTLWLGILTATVLRIGMSWFS